MKGAMRSLHESKSPCLTEENGSVVHFPAIANSGAEFSSSGGRLLLELLCNVPVQGTAWAGLSEAANGVRSYDAPVVVHRMTIAGIPSKKLAIMTNHFVIIPPGMKVLLTTVRWTHLWIYEASGVTTNRLISRNATGRFLQPLRKNRTCLKC